ncbi:hypothetical protein HYT53_05540 [Candidatus Woesearchaeota archaeon]|nr:hypothetical protein [Candidatus Woesearchaeota archaeon]
MSNISVLVIDHNLEREDLQKHEINLREVIKILIEHGYNVDSTQNAKDIGEQHDLIIAHPGRGDASELIAFHYRHPHIPLIMYGGNYQSKKAEKFVGKGFFVDSDGVYVSAIANSEVLNLIKIILKSGKKPQI